MNWDTIFKAGTHTDSLGKTRNWTVADLDKLVANTPLGVPVVIKHPDDEAEVSNYGEIAALRRVGDKLQAMYRNVPSTLRKAVLEGLQLAKSVSIDRSKMCLRHLGLLGANQPPAVDGLGSFHFSKEEQGETYFFNAPNGENKENNMLEKLQKQVADLLAETGTLRQQVADLTAKEAATADHAKKVEAELETAKKARETAEAQFAKAKLEAEEKALAARVDALAESGRILPAEKSRVMAFAKGLNATDEVSEFAAADGKTEKISLREDFLRDLEARKADRDGLLSEFATGGGKTGDENNTDFLKDINNFA